MNTRYVLERIHELLQKGFARVGEFWETIPGLLRAVFIILAIVACFNIVYSLIKAIIMNKATWKKKPDAELMYSFAAGSGQFQRSQIYRDAHKYLLDKKWSVFSFAGLAYRLGNYESHSKTIAFLCSFAYLPMAALGMVEMMLRAAVGVSTYFVLNLAYLLLLVFLWGVNYVLMPLFNLADKTSWVTQHCPKCYTSFKLPVFECPHCGEKHANLYPGRCGLLYAKCTCGHFIPCSSLSKRKELKSYCPKCDYALAGSNIKALTVQVVGGNSSGKTAFIAAFQHQYVEAIQKSGVRDVSLSPEEDFRDLERMYQSGRTEKSATDEVRAYYILHGNKGSSDDGIVIYDVPDEVILSEQYERNPLNFAYSDGIIMIIDPLSIRSVRKECESMTGADSVDGFSDDSTEDIIIHFINKYSEVAGRTARKMSDTPVAVVIAKTDLTAIKRKIGMVKIKAEFSANQNQYGSLEEARDTICRRYLSDIGLANAINNLESVFSRVSFFPVSSIGHCADGSPFDPQNMIAPIGWLARQCKSSINDLTAFVEEESR
jgi:hypothetical protein